MYPPTERLTGPLRGLRVIEIAALGPAPFATMMMADAGATVLRVNRPGQSTADAGILGRHRAASLTLDLKNNADREQLLGLVDYADVFIEGFRPGVMERLGLGPDLVHERNDTLVYARMTGWGQSGPLSSTAGHDINYLALTGTLRSIARSGETPLPPLNLVGDYGGGGMLLYNGILTALFERHSSGKGQVLDVAMIDGATMLMTGIWNRAAAGTWRDEPGTNSIDTGAPFYNVYRTADGEYMAVGSIEPQFYRQLLTGLGLTDADLPDQNDETSWATTKTLFADIFAGRTREQWTGIFAGLDACVSPVLSMKEAVHVPHLRDRGTLRDNDGRTEPGPAPLFSRTPLIPIDRSAVADDVTDWVDLGGQRPELGVAQLESEVSR